MADWNQSAAIDDLRRAVKFQDQVRSTDENISGTGIGRDAREWVDRAARAVLEAFGTPPMPNRRTAMHDESVQVQRMTLLVSDLPKMVVKGWLSPRTSFVVTIDGPFAAKEGAALLRLLGAQLDALKDPQ